MCAIEQGSTHPDEGIVIDVCAVDRYVMSYGHVVTQTDGRFLIERMQHSTVLDITMFAHDDGVDVAAQHGIEPQTGTFPHRHIADDRGILCHEDVVRDMRRKDLAVTIDGFN